MDIQRQANKKRPMRSLLLRCQYSGDLNMYARLPDSCYQTSLLLSFQMVQDSRMTRQTNQKPNMTTMFMFSIQNPIVGFIGHNSPSSFWKCVTQKPDTSFLAQI